MKKIVFPILVFALVLTTFAACGGTSPGSSTPANGSESTSANEGDNGGYEKGTVGDILSNPADYCRTEGAKNAIRAGKIGDWSDIPEQIGRISFGRIYGTSSSAIWTEGSELFASHPLGEDEAYEIVAVAMSQMFDDLDIGADIASQVFEREGPGINMFGPRSFSLDGREFYVAVTFEYDDAGAKRCQVMIGTKASAT